MIWGPPITLRHPPNLRNLLARCLASYVLLSSMVVPILSRTCSLKDLPHKRKKWPSGTNSPALVNHMPSDLPPIMRPLFLSSYCKWEQNPFFTPSIDRKRGILSIVQRLIRNPSAGSFLFLRIVATSTRNGMIIPARWVYDHPWMSSGTVNFPSILVIVTCNQPRCVSNNLSWQERRISQSNPQCSRPRNKLSLMRI